VARGQGASGQKASVGLVLSLEASTGFRRMRRADRATGRSPLPRENPSIGCSNSWPARTMKWKPPHDFCPEAPWPRAWHPVEDHLSVRLISIRLEWFPVFHTRGSSGGHVFCGVG
jgi:hypothetical protein